MIRIEIDEGVVYDGLPVDFSLSRQRAGDLLASLEAVRNFNYVRQAGDAGITVTWMED